MLKLRADDRVLILAIPPQVETAAMARVLLQGCLVAIGDKSEVDEARQTFSEFDNLMFIEAAPGHVPWQEAFFTKIVVPPHLRPLLPAISHELQRLLAPGGDITGSELEA